MIVLKWRPIKYLMKLCPIFLMKMKFLLLAKVSQLLLKRKIIDDNEQGSLVKAKVATLSI